MVDTQLVLSAEHIDALGAVADRAENDDIHDRLCACDGWPKDCASGIRDGSWDYGSWEVALPAVIGLWESIRPDSRAVEISDLRIQLSIAERRNAELAEQLVERDEQIAGLLHVLDNDDEPAGVPW
ncbi:hypothetical protein [Streptomyces sp. NPDC012888]|uniref:hypothetical protein n=1 Tax=Streptomyces sp. NPDC012888 TaxID=3364855 RepID=UPI0036C43616